MQLLTQKEYDRWQRVKSKAEDFEDQIKSKLEEAWKAYKELGLSAKFENFPFYVDEIQQYNGKFVITGQDRHNEHESCQIPDSFVFSDLEERWAEVERRKIAAINEAEVTRLRIEAKEKEEEVALYRKLVAKYGDLKDD